MEEQRLVGNFDHVAIVVRDIEKAKSFFSELLETEFTELQGNEEVGLRSIISFNGLEIISPTRPDSYLVKYMDKYGEGLYALAFNVADAGKARAKAEQMGIRIAGEGTITEGPGAGGREIWLHPKDNFGVYVMFIQGNPFHP